MFIGQQINQAPEPNSQGRTVDEINQAIEELISAQLLRLKKYARWRMKIVPKSLGHTWEDLLSESITATLAGERNWRQGISFEHHLLGAMRSISSRWRNQIGDDIVAYHLSKFNDNPINPERCLTAEEELNQIRELFADDSAALGVLDCLGQGCTAEEAQTALQMSPKEYNTTKKRVSRKMEKWLAAKDDAIKPSNANFKPLQSRGKAN